MNLPRFIDDTVWHTIVPQYCNGTRQSPINIVSANAVADDKLTEFTFYNYHSPTALKTMQNTGKTGEDAVWTHRIQQATNLICPPTHPRSIFSILSSILFQ